MQLLLVDIFVLFFVWLCLRKEYFTVQYFLACFFPLFLKIPVQLKLILFRKEEVAFSLQSPFLLFFHRYLSDLCMCGKRRSGSKPGDPDDLFPTGINLLSYLYQEALDCRNVAKYRLVLSLLRISCGPYLMWVLMLCCSIWMSYTPVENFEIYSRGDHV